jgi:hypothetical protein
MIMAFQRALEVHPHSRGSVSGSQGGPRRDKVLSPGFSGSIASSRRAVEATLGPRQRPPRVRGLIMPVTDERPSAL